MKKYVKPELNATLFESEDILTASSAGTDLPQTYAGAEALGGVDAVKFIDNISPFAE